MLEAWLTSLKAQRALMMRATPMMTLEMLTMALEMLPMHLLVQLALELLLTPPLAS